jgi:CheY-like chemotaxis protein
MKNSVYFHGRAIMEPVQSIQNEENESVDDVTLPMNECVCQTQCLAQNIYRSVAHYACKTSLHHALEKKMRRLTISEEKIEGIKNELREDWKLYNLDSDVSDEQTIEREAERLLDLKSFHVLDHIDESSNLQVSLNQICELAATCLRVSEVFITLIDLGRASIIAGKKQTVIDGGGIYTTINDSVSYPRVDCLSAYTILRNDLVHVVHDTTCHPIFQHMPYAAGPPHLRFYAAASLSTQEGYKIGTISAIDYKPVTFGNIQKQILLGFSDVVMSAFEQHRTLVSKSLELRKSSQILASVSHDLRTPLTGIQLSLNLLDGENSNFSSSQKECLTTANNCAAVMGDICDTLRNRVKNETICDVPKLAKRLKAVMAAIPKQVPFEIHFDEKIPREIVADHLDLFRAALNLLDHSCQRTTNGSIRLTVTTMDNTDLVFTCDDTGPWSTLMTDVVDELFPQTERPKSEKAMILRNIANMPALSSVAALVTSMGGDLGVEMLEDKLTTRVWFKIPLYTPDPGSFLVARNPTESTSTLDNKRSRDCLEGRNNRRALIIDDSVIIRKSLSRALSRLDYETVHAEDGLAGLKEMKKSAFSLVLCDFLMPIMDGLDCVREYRLWEQRERPGFRHFIVGMSAHASEQDIERGTQVGMDYYISKPVFLEQLKELTSRAESATHCDKIESLYSLEMHKGAKQNQRVHQDIIDSGEQNVCLFATRQGRGPALKKLADDQGWKACLVDNEDETLRLLKSRNWGAVLLDDDWLTNKDVSCIQEFREWEQQNRVRRQNYVCLMSDSLSSEGDACSQLPHGVDGIIRIPGNGDSLSKLLARIKSEQSDFGPGDIVTR